MEPTTTGTTLEILAPYLPYGVKVGHFKHPQHFTVMGLSTESNRLDLGAPNYRWHLDECLPVLRPFSALCDPLPDSTVPAVEVVKLFVDLPTNYSERDISVKEYTRYNNRNARFISVYHPLGSGMTAPILRIHEDWRFEIVNGGECDMTAIIDYLRSHHFALGLEPHQFIAK